MNKKYVVITEEQAKKDLLPAGAKNIVWEHIKGSGKFLAPAPEFISLKNGDSAIIKQISDGPYITVVALGPNNKTLGRLSGLKETKKGSLKAINTSNLNVVVDPEFRRNGLASAMYDYAEKITEKKIEPSSLLSDDASEFWQYRLNNKTIEDYILNNETNNKLQSSLGT